MNSDELKQRLIDYTIVHSGHEEHRHYLGMSQVAKCPRVLYYEYLEGTPTNEAGKLLAYAGYWWERSVKDRLKGTLLTTGISRELVARYDNRVIGHTDDETIDGDLIEIKSVTRDKFDRIAFNHHLPEAHYQQVQMYLQHGNYSRAFVIYVARDTGEINVIGVAPNQKLQQRLDVKMIHILKAIDAHEPPACECKQCTR